VLVRRKRPKEGGFADKTPSYEVELSEVRFCRTVKVSFDRVLEDSQKLNEGLGD